MAVLLDGPVAPQDATTITRLVPTPANLAVLDGLLPDRQTEATEIDFNVVTKRGRTARFRAHDAPAHRSGRDQLTTNRIPLIPLSDAKPVLSEREIAQLYGLARSGSPRTPAVQAIYDDLTNSVLDIRRRAVLAKGSVLSTGTLPLNEGGFVGTIDYGVPSGNKVTAPTLWSSTGSADIVTFLNSLRAAYIALNGFPPGSMTTTTSVLNYMQQNTKLQSMVVQQFGPNVGGYAGLLPQNALNAILGAYGLPEVSATLVDTVVDVDGVNTPVIPNNVVIFGPPAGYELGYTAWGPTVTAQKLATAGNLIVDDVVDAIPGIVGFVDRGNEFPYKEQVIADSLMLPALENPNYLMIATVA